MKHKTKFSLLRRSAVAGCALLAAISFGGCKGNDGDLSRIVYHYGASYELRDGQSVMFYITPYVDGNDGKRVYLRLVDVYFNVTTDGEANEGSLQFERDTGPTTVMDTYRYPFASGEKLTKQWIAPFTDEFVNRATFRYYKLIAADCNFSVNEVVFYGEKLTKDHGEPTGEYCLVPAIVYSATPVEGETEEEALKRAGALVDRQNSSFKQIQKFKESKE